MVGGLPWARGYFVLGFYFCMVCGSFVDWVVEVEFLGVEIGILMVDLGYVWRFNIIIYYLVMPVRYLPIDCVLSHCFRLTPL